MRRIITVTACLSVLMLSAASTALAHGPYHRGPVRGPAHHHHGHRAYRPPACAAPIYAPRPRVAAYPVYPVPVVPVAPAYPRLGFGLGGSNFSFWFQQ